MTKKIKRTGRPPNDPTRPPVQASALYQLLLKTVPTEYVSDDGKLDTDKLSAAIGSHRFTFYRWFSGAYMSVSSAHKLVELSAKGSTDKGALTKEMLAPFCGL